MVSSKAVLEARTDETPIRSRKISGAKQKSVRLVEKAHAERIIQIDVDRNMLQRCRNESLRRKKLIFIIKDVHTFCEERLLLFAIKRMNIPRKLRLKTFCFEEELPEC